MIFIVDTERNDSWIFRIGEDEMKRNMKMFRETCSIRNPKMRKILRNEMNF